MRAGRLWLSVLGVLCAALLAGPASALAFGPISSFGSLGEGAGQMDAPSGTAIGADGNVYVADSANYRIDVFTAAGGFLFAFGKGVNAGDGDPDVCTTACQAGVEKSFAAGALYGPEGIAFDAVGNAYVANWGGFRIDVFSPQGDFLFGFGKDVDGEADVCTTACDQGSGDGTSGSMSNPTGVDVDPGAERVFVASNTMDRINVYTTAGGFLRAFGKGVNIGAGDPNVCTTECQDGDPADTAGAMNRPFDVALVPGDLVAVSDRSNRRVDVFTATGTFVRAFGADVGPAGADVCTLACQAGALSTAVAGALESPTAASLSPAATLYVGDADLHRVSEFNLDGSFIRAFGAGVVDGSASFQVCTIASGCTSGLTGSLSGAVSEPYGIAFTASKTFVSEEAEGPDLARVEVFGEGGPGPTPTAPVVPVAPVTRSPNKINVGRLTLNKRAGTGALAVRVPAAGALFLKGTGIKQVKRSAKRATTLRVPVRLVGKAKATLLETGKARVTGKLTFAPTGGKARAITKKLTLKKN